MSLKSSADANLAVVKTTTLSKVALLNKYCREKGFYSEQVKAWRQTCLNGQKATVFDYNLIGHTSIRRAPDKRQSAIKNVQKDSIETRGLLQNLGNILGNFC